MHAIDINCDMGESTSLWKYSVENDIALFPYISSINLACGFHAGDAHTMHELADAALTAGIAIGAHPGFADRENFGRTNQSLAPSQVYDIVLYQIGALDAFLKIRGTKLHHVKPHGALYNMAAKEEVLAEAICNAVKDYDKALLLYGLSGSELIGAADKIGLSCCSEVFADRSYQDDGSLTPRVADNAMIETKEAAIQQVLQMVKEQSVRSVNGKMVPITAQTICIHGDGIHALEFARAIHRTLQAEQISITA
jgi:5-oxoprolinase (ATP-hydrolysing) subunit A